MGTGWWFQNFRGSLSVERRNISNSLSSAEICRRGQVLKTKTLHVVSCSHSTLQLHPRDKEAGLGTLLSHKRGSAVGIHLSAFRDVDAWRRGGRRHPL